MRGWWCVCVCAAWLTVAGAADARGVRTCVPAFGVFVVASDSEMVVVARSGEAAHSTGLSYCLRRRGGFHQFFLSSPYFAGVQVGPIRLAGTQIAFNSEFIPGLGSDPPYGFKVGGTQPAYSVTVFDARMRTSRSDIFAVASAADVYVSCVATMALARNGDVLFLTGSCPLVDGSGAAVAMHSLEAFDPQSGHSTALDTVRPGPTATSRITDLRLQICSRRCSSGSGTYARWREAGASRSQLIR